MELRLVVLILFGLAVGWVMTLGMNKEYELTGKININEMIKEHKEALAKAKEGHKAKKEPVEQVQEDPGKVVYFKTGKCITCHGSKALGKESQGAPMLAGQFDWYIVSSLKKFQSGERDNPKMMPYIRKLTDADFEAVANYLSKLPGGLPNEEN